MSARLTFTLLDAGLGVRAKPLAALARPCVRLRVEGVSPEDWPVGTSKLGGAPDVPPEFEWPEWQGLPLAFIGQVDLADAARFEAAAPLPSAGVLSLFYHSEQTAWGYDPADRGSARVYWFPDATRLRRVPIPERVPRTGRFAAARLSLREELTIPTPWSLEVEELGLSEAEVEAYRTVWVAWLPAERGAAQHQLLGHPNPMQGEMQVECQLASNGVNCGDPGVDDDPRVPGLEPGAREWRLLAQIDSDDAPDMMWGDVGMLYWWIREADLAERRFERAWLVFQCA